MQVVKLLLEYLVDGAQMVDARAKTSAGASSGPATREHGWAALSIAKARRHHEIVEVLTTQATRDAMWDRLGEATTGAETPLGSDVASLAEALATAARAGVVGGEVMVLAKVKLADARAAQAKRADAATVMIATAEAAVAEAFAANCDALEDLIGAAEVAGVGDDASWARCKCARQDGWGSDGVAKSMQRLKGARRAQAQRDVALAELAAAVEEPTSALYSLNVDSLKRALALAERAAAEGPSTCTSNQQPTDEELAPARARIDEAWDAQASHERTTGRPNLSRLHSFSASLVSGARPLLILPCV